MPTFTYTAKSFSGELKSGTMEAANERELARLLRQEGFILTSAEIPEKKKFVFKLPPLFPWAGVSLTEKMMLVRNLRVMVGAGISIPRALNILSAQAKSRRLKGALGKISEAVVGGRNFSDGLAEHPGIFSELFVSMIRVGEESGTLDEVLSTLNLQMEREHELKSKIKGALMYPAVVILAMIGVGILMLIVVVPQLAAIFKELNIELPLTTRIVIGLGTFLSNFWYTLPFIILIWALVFRVLLASKPGKKAKDKALLNIPIIGQLIKQSNAAYITRTLGSLISAGVPFVQALEILARSVGNEYFKQAIIAASERTKKGEKLSGVLADYQTLFPATVVQMLQVGEETGQTADILQKLAEFYEEEVTNATKNIASVIEPILMLIIGATVGFFAVSMIQPMYSMLGTL